METVYLSKICYEDIDIGVGTRDVRLFDNSVYSLRKISSSGELAIRETKTQAATASASTVTVTFSNPAASKIHGVTVEVTTGLGGATSFHVGTAKIPKLWGENVAVTQGTTTTAADFFTDAEPIDDNGNYAVVLTAVGATFNGTGAFEVQLHYSKLTHH